MYGDKKFNKKGEPNSNVPTSLFPGFWASEPRA